MSWPQAWEEDDRLALREQAEALVGDLARRWAVPPDELLRALARESVKALCREPDLLGLLAAQVGRAVRAACALERLEARGVRFRVARGVLRAGPHNALTPPVRAVIHRHKREFVLILEGRT